MEYPAAAAGPAPVADATSEAYWQAARNGVLMGGECGSCGQRHWYPRPHCPYCHRADVELAPLGAEGVLYSCTTIERTPDPAFAAVTPYMLALVDLGGARVFGFLDGDADVGDPVSLEIVRHEDRALPIFRPCT